MKSLKRKKETNYEGVKNSHTGRTLAGSSPRMPPRDHRPCARWRRSCALRIRYQHFAALLYKPKEYKWVGLHECQAQPRNQVRTPGKGGQGGALTHRGEGVRCCRWPQYRGEKRSCG
eukprot:3214136-Rhodomonas_salina.1